MYCQFYGLKERPFNVTSDPAFFFLSKKHKEALSHLLYGISQRKGIMVLTGEIGTGKTTLCRFCLNQLDAKVKTALILNPYFSATQLIEAIVRDFGIKTKDKTRIGLVSALNQFLLDEAAAGNNVVLIVDEAQNLKPDLLEQIRLLSNLETEKDKLLQVILAGQPELNDRLNLHDLRQLRQRIMVRYHISPLDQEEVRDYVDHRLKVAGAQPRKLRVNDDAIHQVTIFSKGTPRLINMICDRALLAGFVAESPVIDGNIMKRCISEFQPYCVGEHV